jgi:hypothetical protein
MPRKAGTKDSDMVKKAQYTVVVSPDIRAFFQSAVIQGTGGFQSLGRHLKDQLMVGDVVVMDEQLFRRVVRTATQYGDGGFQTKLKKLAVLWLDQNINQVTKAFNG